MVANGSDLAHPRRTITHGWAGPFMICVWLASTLINSSAFIHPTQAAFYGFVIGGCALCAYALITGGFLVSKLTLTPGALILWAGWSLYAVVQGHFFRTQPSGWQHILGISFLTLYGCYLLFSRSHFPYLKLCYGIAALVLFEDGLCLLQWTNLIPSANTHFAVSGSWSNPNVTAMFLVMTLPALWTLGALEKRSYSKKASWALLLFTSTALVLLQCRSAYLGAGVALCILFEERLRLEWRKANEKGKFSSYALLTSIAVGLIVLSFYLYNHKKASADARFLIWKVSGTMIADRPIFGCGFGLFEKEYGFKQAEYLMTASNSERYGASHVFMAYNEYLQQCLEGGIVAELLFLALVIVLIRGFWRKQLSTDPFHRAAAAGLSAFLLMSFFNFTIQALPAFALFISYAATVIVRSKGKIPVGKPALQAVRWALVLGSFYIFFNYVSVAKADLLNRKAARLIRHHVPSSIGILKRIEPQLFGNESYHWNYAYALSQLRLDQQALAQYQKATESTSSPQLFLSIGACYERLQHWSQAENAYRTAWQLQPGLFRPPLHLMRLYLNRMDTIQASRMALEIVRQPVKVRSPEVSAIREEASQLIKSF